MASNYDELYHHGILGMHWGKRNGPPYPLNSNAHSASEKKAGWRKSLDGGSNVSVKKKEKKTQEATKSLGSGTHIYREEENNKDKYREEKEKRSVSYESGSKGVKGMSDKELQDAINRMKLENDYARLTTEGQNRSQELNDKGNALNTKNNIKQQLNKLKPEEKFERTKLDVSNIPKNERQAAIDEHNKAQAALESDFNRSKGIKNAKGNLQFETAKSVNRLAKVKNEANQVKLQNEAREVAKSMEYKDLKSTVDRLNMEKQYNDLVNSQQKKTGEVYLKNALEITGAVLAVAVPAYQLYKEVKKPKGGTN